MPKIIILGATSDVAMATAKQFATHDFDIILAARNVNRLDPFKKDLELRFNNSVSLLEFDAVDFESHKGITENLDGGVDVVIYFAGYLDDQEQTEKDFSEMLRTININYTGGVTILSHFANYFKKAGGGTIIGVSSVAGERGRMSNYYYGSAKAGFTAFLSGLRNRMYHAGVHVISVIPGFMYTKMTEGLELPGMLTAHPDQAAKSIYKAYTKKRNVVYVKWMWRYIMLVIKLIPEGIFKKLRL